MKTFYFKKTYRSFPFLLFIAFVTISCQKELDLEIATSDKRLLVNAEFTNDSAIHTAKLSKPGSILNEHPQVPVSGAKVYVTDFSDTLYFTESDTMPGLYQTTRKCRGIGGKTYELSISNIDIDEDGQSDEFKARATMPVPIVMDSLKSERGVHPSDQTAGINNWAFFRVFYNGPDYIYNYIQVNDQAYRTIHDRLGTGELARAGNDYRIAKPNQPGLIINRSKYFHLDEDICVVKKGDMLTFICFNLTRDYFNFLKTFDNNTSSGDLFLDNFFDQIKMPENLPTNIEPATKAAGYFSVYSISRISKKMEE